MIVAGVYLFEYKADCFHFQIVDLRFRRLYGWDTHDMLPLSHPVNYLILKIFGKRTYCGPFMVVSRQERLFLSHSNELCKVLHNDFTLGSATSEGTLFKDPVIKKIAEAHGKTPAQIILRWHIQDGFYVIPSASTPDYIKENIRIFDFALTDDEMRQMRPLNKEKRFFNMPLKDKERIYLNT